MFIMIKWRPPSLSELTPMLFNTGLTHFSSEASKCLEVYTLIEVSKVFLILQAYSISWLFSNRLGRLFSVCIINTGDGVYLTIQNVIVFVDKNVLSE